MPGAHLNRRNLVTVVVVLLTTIALGRILLTYKVTAQTFDEPCHVAAGIELLDRHTYMLDPVHPPLTRIAIGLPLYLAGERFPKWPKGDLRLDNYNDVGNSILYDSGHYLRNLFLARSAILPFFVLAVALVFFWTRREFGSFAGVMSVILFTTLPIVLAFSGLAYTDLPTSCLQFGALFAFTVWLEKPTTRSSLVLGCAIALALLCKLTGLLFLPSAAVAIFLTKILVGRSSESSHLGWKEPAKGLLFAGSVAVILTWAGYGFSIGHVRESTGLSADTMPSFQHFPVPMRAAARYVVVHDSPVPAPALFMGLATAWSLNKSDIPAYLLGHVKPGGWPYFFLVGIGVKTPIPVLLLAAVGAFAIFRFARQGKWQALAPLVSVLAILIVTMPVKYNAGVRHVLVIFPLLCVMAAAGCAYLWGSGGKWRLGSRLVLCVLLAWQCGESLRAHPDYIAYFNQFAGRDPSKVLVAGCDLDCGQDMFRLAESLHDRNISYLHLAMWSSADPLRSGLPKFDVPQPFQPTTGWVAISMRALRFGDVFHHSYPPEAFAWIEKYEPVAQVGKTIRLYYIPEATAGSLK